MKVGVVGNVNPHTSGHTSDFFRICEYDPASGPPEHYTEEDYQPFGDLLSEIFAEIWRVRNGKPVVLRTVDIYDPAPALSAWRAAGILPECLAAGKVVSETIREAAEANGVTMVSIRGLFNGPQRDQDPPEGYIGSDGYHTSQEGAAAIADALAAVGFEPVTGP